MKLDVTCLYCDHKWETYMYSESALESVRCPKCGDKNLKAKKQAAKVDYYTTGKEDK